MEQQEKKWFTLSIILNRVKTIFDNSISGKSFWMKVEIAQIKEDRRGHIYLELVENIDGVVLAKCRATIWNSTASRIMIKLGDQAGKVLKEGTEILCLCDLIYSPVYGMSINILDVDLSFSLGELERQKQETIKKLQQKGLINLNKEREYPIVIQRIALISAKGTAGHEDFVNHLKSNEYGYYFDVDNFDSKVQGENAHISIIERLSQIPENVYDVIVLLRGGGATLDLDVFNNYALAEKIAKSETAVFTGIGHETDVTIADIVANTRFKTPSAVAAFIIERAYQFDVKVSRTYEGIQEVYKNMILVRRHRLELAMNSLKSESKQLVSFNNNSLQSCSNQIIHSVKKNLLSEKTKLAMMLQNIQYKPTAFLLSAEQSLKKRGQFLALFAEQVILDAKNKIDSSGEMLSYRVDSLMKKERLKLERLEAIPEFYNFESILKKGFAIVKLNGHTINQYTTLSIDDELEIEIYNKVYLIQIKNIKEIERWKSLLTKKQQTN